MSSNIFELGFAIDSEDMVGRKEESIDFLT